MRQQVVHPHVWRDTVAHGFSNPEAFGQQMRYTLQAGCGCRQTAQSLPGCWIVARNEPKRATQLHVKIPDSKVDLDSMKDPEMLLMHTRAIVAAFLVCLLLKQFWVVVQVPGWLMQYNMHHIILHIK